MLESVNVNVASIAVIPLDWSAVRGAESDNSWRGCGGGVAGDWEAADQREKSNQI